MKKPILKQRTTLAAVPASVLAILALFVNSPETQEVLNNLAIAGVAAALAWLRQTVNHD